MNNLINLSNEQKMSSREIANLTGKEHRNVLRDCDNLNEYYEKMSLLKIEQCNYKAENGQTYREYLLTKMQCFDLLTGYRTDLRIKVNRRWEELEAKTQLDFSNPDTVLMLAQNWKEEQEKRLALEKQNEENKPKVLFTDAVIGSKSSCLIGELAKLITQNGYQIGQNRLFKWLRKNGYLGLRGENYNIPNQKYIEQGLFELKKGTRTGNDGVMHTTITPKVTGKGQVYFVNKFLSLIPQLQVG